MRHLTNSEVFYLNELLNGRQANKGEAVVISGEELLDLRAAFKAEVNQRAARIPENWREQAIAHALDQGVTVYTLPGVAGGVRAPKASPTGQGVKIDDVDALLVLVGDCADLIPEA